MPARCITRKIRRYCMKRPHGLTQMLHGETEEKISVGQEKQREEIEIMQETTLPWIAKKILAKAQDGLQTNLVEYYLRKRICLVNAETFEESYQQLIMQAQTAS